MKFLFIGNSHTYYNDMPHLFQRICEENGMDAEVTMLAHGGKGLDFHRAEPEVRFNILYGNYDYIILQHLAHPFDDEDMMFESAAEIDRYIQNTRSKKVLYMTWAQKNNPSGQARMTKAYKELSKKLSGSVVAPVGIAWWRFLEGNPPVDLFDSDGRHASPIGSQLVAYTLFSTMFGRRADAKGSLNQLLSQTAFETVCEFQKNN